jgi:hypothetical protein
MRSRLALSLLLIVILAAGGPACGGSPGPSPTAAIAVRVPATITARLCTRCGNLIGEMEVAVDVVIEETAGVGGQVMSVVVVLEAGSGPPIEGPGTFDQPALMAYGPTTMRVNPRGSLTIPEFGVHFAPSQLSRLPGTLRLTVTFRDDNSHTLSTSVAIGVNP